MTEEVTPKKKPRRKRRTKAQIEAEKKAAAEVIETVEAPKEEVQPISDETWQKTDEVIVEMFEEAVASEEVVVEEPAPVVEESVDSEPCETCEGEAAVDALEAAEAVVVEEPEPKPVAEVPAPTPKPVTKAPAPAPKERRRFGYAGVRQRMAAARRGKSQD